ncbi:MAG: hypothetical protein M1837_002577 [Sclerophora amabilis]|nr:MAG: hypothetical protein M1837_002577 [Sclerophora amabilis]
MQLPVLREQDFGFYEGKPFYARPADSKRSGKEAHQDQHKHEADFQDVESKDSMAVRMDCFLNEHLIPVLAEQTLSENAAIVVVSHGIILSVLWRCFLRRFLVGNISATPGLLPAGNSPEYLGGWSNTGYLEIEVTVGDFPLLDATTTADADVDQTNTAPQSTSLLTGWRISIKTVNGRDHLQGFKRTRGGVGSSKHEEGQRKIESFFKKKKIG